MLRVVFYILLVASLFGLAAYQSGGPKFPERLLPANSTVANFFYENVRPAPEAPATPEVDSVRDLHILMLNYSAYDSAYVAKIKGMIEQRLPGVMLTDFWNGSDQSLKEALVDQQIVVITYPSTGETNQIRRYGKLLNQFVQQGGAVVVSGTDQFGILQHYDLVDLDFGYFCTDFEVHESAVEHPILRGTPAEFALANYIYPLDISDPNFVVLADVRGYPALGFKPLGAGKIVYLGLEYYYDESISTLILENTLRWLAPASAVSPVVQSTEERVEWTARSVRRSEETLFAGSGKSMANAPDFSLKIYPNPYFDKATLDLNLQKPDPVSVEMTDETGVAVAVLLPYRMLNSGFYRLELPNVSPGVYFVKCQVGTQTSVRKVVKVATQ
jgi:hypothetical protein